MCASSRLEDTLSTRAADSVDRELDFDTQDQNSNFQNRGILNDRLARNKVLEILLPSANPRISNNWVRFTDHNKKNWYLNWNTRETISSRPENFHLLEENDDREAIFSYAKTLFERIESNCSANGDDSSEYNLESIIASTTFLTVPGKSGGLDGGPCCGGSPLWIKKRSILDDREYHCGLLNDSVHWPKQIEKIIEDYHDSYDDRQSSFRSKDKSVSGFEPLQFFSNSDWEQFYTAFIASSKSCTELASKKQKEEECLSTLLLLTLSVIDLPSALSSSDVQKITRNLIEEFIERYDNFCKLLIRFSLAVKVSYEHYPPPNVYERLDKYLEGIVDSFQRIVELASKSRFGLYPRFVQRLVNIAPADLFHSSKSPSNDSSNRLSSTRGSPLAQQTTQPRMYRIGSIFVPSFQSDEYKNQSPQKYLESPQNLDAPSPSNIQLLEFPTPPSNNEVNIREYPRKSALNIPKSGEREELSINGETEDLQILNSGKEEKFCDDCTKSITASYINCILSAVVDISSFYKVIHKRILELLDRDSNTGSVISGDSVVSPCVHSIRESFQTYVVNILSNLKKIIIRSQSVLAENCANKDTVLKFKACILPLKAHYIDFSFMNNPSTHKSSPKTCLQETIITLLATNHTLCLMLLSIKVIINDHDIAKNKVLTLWEQEVYERCSESRDKLYSVLKNFKFTSENPSDVPYNTTNTFPQESAYEGRISLLRRNFRSVYVSSLNGVAPGHGLDSRTLVNQKNFSESSSKVEDDGEFPSSSSPSTPRPMSCIVRRNSINRMVWKDKRPTAFSGLKVPFDPNSCPPQQKNLDVSEKELSDQNFVDQGEDSSSSVSEVEEDSPELASSQIFTSADILEPPLISYELAHEFGLAKGFGSSKESEHNLEYLSKGFNASLNRIINSNSKSKSSSPVVSTTVNNSPTNNEAQYSKPQASGVLVNKPEEKEISEDNTIPRKISDEVYSTDDGMHQTSSVNRSLNPKDDNTSNINRYNENTINTTTTNNNTTVTSSSHYETPYISNQDKCCLITPDHEELLSVLRTQSEELNLSADSNRLFNKYEPSILPDIADHTRNRDNGIVTLKKVQKVLGSEAPKKQKVTSSSHMFSPLKDRQEMRLKSNTALNNFISTVNQQGMKLNPCAVCLHDPSEVVFSRVTMTIEAMTIDAVAEHLLMPVQMLCDFSFERTVFLTYTTLMGTVDFINKLIDTYHILISSRMRMIEVETNETVSRYLSEINAHQIVKIVSVLNVLIMEDYIYTPTDSIREAVYGTVTSFLSSELEKKHDPVIIKLINTVMNRANEKYAKDSKNARNKNNSMWRNDFLEINSINNDAEALGAPKPMYKSTGYVSFYNLHTIELARQLTILEIRNYYRLNHFLLLQSATEKLNHREENSLTVITRTFNLISSWVSLTILSAKDYKERASTIGRFINLCENCYYLNNYNTLVAILSSLSSSPIQRLKKSWRLVPWETNLCLTELCDIMMPYKNFSLYRKTLELKGNSPSVPFIGFYLTDLTFVHNGMPSMTSHRQIAASRSGVHNSSVIDQNFKGTDDNNYIPGQQRSRRGYNPGDSNAEPLPRQFLRSDKHSFRDTSLRDSIPSGVYQLVNNSKIYSAGGISQIQPPNSVQVKPNHYSNEMNLVNVNKLYKYSQILKDILKYQSFLNVFIPVPEIQLWLESTLNNSKIDPSKLYDMSLKIES